MEYTRNVYPDSERIPFVQAPPTVEVFWGNKVEFERSIFGMVAPASDENVYILLNFSDEIRYYEVERNRIKYGRTEPGGNRFFMWKDYTDPGYTEWIITLPKFKSLPLMTDDMKNFIEQQKKVGLSRWEKKDK